MEVETLTSDFLTEDIYVIELDLNLSIQDVICVKVAVINILVHMWKTCIHIFIYTLLCFIYLLKSLKLRLEFSWFYLFIIFFSRK